MWIKIKYTFKILMTGQLKAAWWYFTYVGREKISLNQEEEYDVYYPEDDFDL